MSALSGLNLEKMQGLSPGTKKTVRNHEGRDCIKWMSVMRGLNVIAKLNSLQSKKVQWVATSKTRKLLNTVWCS